MASIHDRCGIKTYDLSHIKNVLSHSTELAALCARVASMAYGLATQSHARGVQTIPASSVRETLSSGRTVSVRDWFEAAEGVSTFSVSVIGGSAFGVLLGGSLIVGFRGTTNADDWGINLYTDDRVLPMMVPLTDRRDWDVYPRYKDMQNTPHVSLPRVHCGFLRVAAALQRAIQAEITLLERQQRERNNDWCFDKLIYCGHSLGGALAILAMLTTEHGVVYLHHSHDWIPPIYTFGMPRVGSKELVPLLPKSHFRYVVKGDPVAVLPPSSLGFVHDSPAVVLDPYRGLPKPGLIRKLVNGVSRGNGFRDKISKGVTNVMAAEHDLDLYIQCIDELK